MSHSEVSFKAPTSRTNPHIFSRQNKWSNFPLVPLSSGSGAPINIESEAQPHSSVFLGKRGFRLKL